MSVHHEWHSTARLSLRPPTQADSVAVLRVLSNHRVVEHNPSELVVELCEVEALLGRWLEHWAEHGFGNCCVLCTCQAVGQPSTTTDGARRRRWRPSSKATSAQAGTVSWTSAAPSVLLRYICARADGVVRTDRLSVVL